MHSRTCKCATGQSRLGDRVRPEGCQTRYLQAVQVRPGMRGRRLGGLRTECGVCSSSLPLYEPPALVSSATEMSTGGTFPASAVCDKLSSELYSIQCGTVGSTCSARGSLLETTVCAVIIITSAGQAAHQTNENGGLRDRECDDQSTEQQQSVPVVRA
jgi:hypothetical protein